MIRSFIAIELPKEVKKELAQLSNELGKARYSSIRWVDSENIHLTLKFLGNVRVNQVPQITEAMKEGVYSIPPFYLEISGVGAFPNTKQPRVIWVGISGEIDKLSQLQRSINSMLTPLGFVEEKRPFAPHLTIARVKDNASSVDRKALGQLLMSTKFESKWHIAVNSIHLMKSQLTPDGAIYSRLSIVNLQGK